MINKKINAGILTVVVLLAAIQTVAPVLAEAQDGDDSLSTVFITVSSGHGTVCWFGARILNGCTQESKYVSARYETLIIFTAVPADSSTFIGWNVDNNYASTNPYTLAVPCGGEYLSVSASFTK